jgi:hypothetical protein
MGERSEALEMTDIACGKNGEICTENISADTSSVFDHRQKAKRVDTVLGVF